MTTGSTHTRMLTNSSKKMSRTTSRVPTNSNMWLGWKSRVQILLARRPCTPSTTATETSSLRLQPPERTSLLMALNKNLSGLMPLTQKTSFRPTNRLKQVIFWINDQRLNCERSTWWRRRGWWMSWSKRSSQSGWRWTGDNSRLSRSTPAELTTGKSCTTEIADSLEPCIYLLLIL